MCIRDREKALHRTIDTVRSDYAALRTNTAIARMIELNNLLTKLDRVPRAAVEPLVQLVGPVAHLALDLDDRGDGVVHQQRRVGLGEGGVVEVLVPQSLPQLGGAPVRKVIVRAPTLVNIVV